jgi:transposase InsO family protein/predicted kinase
MAGNSRSHYSQEQREQALHLARMKGIRPAARELGMPPATIGNWLKLKTEAEAAKADPPTLEEPKASGKLVDQSCPPPQSAAALEAASREGVVAAGSKPDATDPVAAALAKRKVSGTLVAKLYTPSQRAAALDLASIEGVAAAARLLGISRFSIYDWRRQTALHAQGKAENSPVVGSDENKAEARDLRILAEWKTHPGLGPSQVRNQLRRQGLKVSVHTVRCVLEENGYVTPKVRREVAHDQRYEAVRPDYLWHLDFLHRHINKQKIYVLLIIDDFSRFIVGGAIWDGERVAAVQETFMEAVGRHGKPEKAMSDGGSAFYAWKGIGGFTRLLDELELDQIIARIPQVNGKLEVLNANIQKEFFNQEKLFDLGEAQLRLKAWIHFYNFRRTHQALGGLLVPADRYFGRADEVMAHIEAGRSPDGVGEPISPGERQLDIFRITSQRGQIEIHLLGHRIVLPNTLRVT